MLHSLLEPLVRRTPVVIIYALLHHELQIQIANIHILLPAFDSQALCTFGSMYTEVIYIHLMVQCVTNIDFHIHMATFVYCALIFTSKLIQSEKEIQHLTYEVLLMMSLIVSTYDIWCGCYAICILNN